MLAAAAVIGPRFAVADLEEVLGADPLEVARARARGRVSCATTATARCAFAHALVQETLLAELSTVRRVRLHRRVADVLAARSGDVSEIARHRFEAAAGGGGAEAAEALEAGRRSGAVGARVRDRGGPLRAGDGGRSGGAARGCCRGTATR